MDFKQLQHQNEELKVKIETFHLFYEDFTKYDVMISNATGILAEMLSSLIKQKKSGEANETLAAQEKNIFELFDYFENLNGLKNHAQSQKLNFRHTAQANFNLEVKIKKLEFELESIKKAHNQ